MAKRKKTIIPPSLQPRKITKKSIPGSKKVAKTEKAKAVKKQTTKSTPPPVVTTPPIVEKPPVVAKASPSPTPPPTKAEKKRFTLWLQEETFRAFKVHVAINGGKASDYIESLIRKDLNL